VAGAPLLAKIFFSKGLDLKDLDVLFGTNSNTTKAKDRVG
jgi:hypothetical protein